MSRGVRSFYNDFNGFVCEISEVVVLNVWPLGSGIFIFDLKFGFLVKNCICSLQEMSRISNLGLIGGLGPFKMGFKEFRGEGG